MTGFGIAERAWPERGASVRVELRSVNARFLELKVRQPFDVGVEHRLRKAAEARLGRGRVDVSVRVDGGEATSDPLAALGVAPDRLAAALAAMAAIEAEASSNDVELSQSSSLELLRFLSSSRGSGASAGDRAQAPPAFLDAVVGEALTKLVGMREREGEALTGVLGELYDALEAQTAALAKTLDGEPDRLRAAMLGRLEQLVGDAAGVDRERVAQEVALLIQKGDISEELARIASHLAQAREVLDGEAEPGQGKTLEFLGQELLREVTTIGSKITSHRGSAIVIEAKRTIERLREQVQNVE